jgi:hypothetical protein
MNLFRLLILFFLCITIAMVWSTHTYEPGKLFYHSVAVIYLPPNASSPSNVETLRKGKDFLESEGFRLQAADHLAALQTQRARQLGPGQLLKEFESSQASLAESLARSYTVYLNEITPALILSISGESQAFVSAILEVVPDLLVKFHRSNAAGALSVLSDEIHQVLSSLEEQDRILAQTLWNLKGTINAKFADRPISKRGSISTPVPTIQALATLPSNVTAALDSVHEKLAQRQVEDGYHHRGEFPSLENAWNLLEEALQVKSMADSLIQEASALPAVLASTTSMKEGPLPEKLDQLERALADVQARREVLTEQTAGIEPSAVPSNTESEHSLQVERKKSAIVRVGGMDRRSHFLTGGLCGLVAGIAVALIGSIRLRTKRRRV